MSAWEQRWHPLREEWVVVSAHRQQRPWLGERVDTAAPVDVPRRDPACAFCPGGARAGGAHNPDYDAVLVFDNDLPVVGPDAPTALDPVDAPFRSRAATGVARVVCYTPRHDLSLARLPLDEVVGYLEVLQQQYLELGAMSGVEHVLVFENRGEVVGVSNPHPHCQIYATNFVFRTIELEAQVCQRHLEQNGVALLEDVIEAERRDGRRLLFERDGALAFVPYFARYPYEVFVAPRQTRPSLAALDRAELHDFARVLQRTLIAYDNLWQMPFPYVMALHQAPTDGQPHDGFHFHVELHPPLRRPDLLKYPAGPEIGGGNWMNDAAPEQSADELRATDPAHYRGGEA